MWGCFTSFSYWSFLRTLRVNASPTKAHKVVIVLWHAPKPRWDKINCDGAALGSSGKAGSGGLFLYMSWVC